MQRVLAVLLLGLVSLGLIAPAFAANAPSLPACCHAKGKHHCAMQIASAAQQGDASIHAVQEKCPCFPGVGMMASGSHMLSLSGPEVFFGSLASHPAIQAQTEARYRISFSRSQQKRGPPSLVYSLLV